MTTSSFAAIMGSSPAIRIVDVGANSIDGPPLYTPLLCAGATLVGFEPHPDAFGRLIQGKRDNETYLPHAIGDGKAHTLHICAAEGMTSLLSPNPAVLNLFHGFSPCSQVTAKQPVETVRLDDIDEASGADMLKIDIQGGELMALQHAETLLKSLLVIQTEVEFLPMYVNQPLFSDVDQFLRSRGFVLHRFCPTVSGVISPMPLNKICAGMGQLVWADAIFVRDFTRLETWSDRQLVATAAILHDCYGSFDLALHLLTEHDRRTGATLAPAYLAGLQPQAAPLAA